MDGGLGTGTLLGGEDNDRLIGRARKDLIAERADKRLGFVLLTGGQGVNSFAIHALAETDFAL